MSTYKIVKVNNGFFQVQRVVTYLNGHVRVSLVNSHAGYVDAKSVCDQMNGGK
jgi:hypothetical protein